MGNSICVETKKQSCYKCPKYKCLSSEATSTEDVYPETPESSAYFEETESFYPETLDFTSHEKTQTEEFSNETPDFSTFTTDDLIPTYPPHKDDNASCVVCTQQTCSGIKRKKMYHISLFSTDPCPYAAMACVDVRKQTCKKCAKWECVALANIPANSTGGLSMSTPTI